MCKWSEAWNCGGLLFCGRVVASKRGAMTRSRRCCLATIYTQCHLSPLGGSCGFLARSQTGEGVLGEMLKRDIGT